MPIGSTGSALNVPTSILGLLEELPESDTVIHQWDAQEAFTDSDEGQTLNQFDSQVGGEPLTQNSFTVLGDGINGNRAIDLDGQLEATIGQVDPPITVFGVVEKLPSQPDENIYLMDALSNGRGSIFYNNSGGWSAFLDGPTNILTDENRGTQFISLRVDGPNSLLRENGFDVGSNDLGTPSFTGLMLGDSPSAGGGTTATMPIGFLEIHDTALSDSELVRREEDIISYWTDPAIGFGSFKEGPDVSGAGSSPYYIGATQVPDGRVILAPSSAGTVGIYDPATDSFTEGPSSGGGFQHSLLDGERVIMIPNNGTNIGIFDSSDDSYSTVSAASGYQGGTVLDDGTMVFAPSGASDIGLFDPSTDTFTTGATTPGGYTGGAQVPDGRVIFAPRRASNFGIYDPGSDTFTEQEAHNRGNYAYQDAILTDTNNVVILPTRADPSNVVVFDPSDDSFNFNDETEATGADPYESGLFHSTGVAVFTPATNSEVGLYDAGKDTYQDGAGTGNSDETISFQGETELDDGTVVFAPRSSDTIGIWEP